MATTTGSITEGPSKFDLMAALFDGKQVQFTIVMEGRKHQISTQIKGMRVENRDLENWSLEGSFTLVRVLNGNLVEFKAKYEMRRRQGTIDIPL